ncbi:MAG: bifunctional (p)ppGpp synthetase/guanosine-3',5'-bis(diphosphate) 3'-pyrophosphohydrolase [bacterium]
MSLPGAKQQRMLEELLTVCRANLPKVNEEDIRKSFQLSYEAHKNHFRASGEPYFNHPYEAALIVANEIPLDYISVVAALLHDVVEDTDITLEFISKEFGKEVGDIVDGVTKIGGVFKEQDFTQAENYRKLLLSMVKDVRVILVKFADRLHNMRTLEFVNPDKQRRIAKETLEIYAPFTHRFGLGKVKWELEDLAFKYLNKEAYDEIARKLNEKRKERESYINQFIKPIIAKLKEHGLTFEIGGRPKHLYSIYRKMIRLNSSFDQIYDLLAVRIILENNDQNQCFYVLGIINSLYTPIPDRFKDYISIPKKNNYQSIHNTVVGPDGKHVEIQIRTRQMHEIAERGVAAHWKYKENVQTASQDIEDWVNWVRDIFENVSKAEASEEVIQSFELNLYQDEIYVFTPKGDLKHLPVSSTPVDFAFEIHSNIGNHCIGAKVNGKIVPLDSKLHSGDQVEIITSKNQQPNKSWLRFVVTHKAQNHVRRYLKKEEDRIVDEGKDIWNKKLKKSKLSFSVDDFNRLLRKLKYENPQQFYKSVAMDHVNIDEIINPVEAKPQEEESQLKFEKFIDIARKSTSGIVVEGIHKGFQYSYAKCCNPIPGDQVVGFITIGEGIKIHRKNCKNLLNMTKLGDDKLVPVQWPKSVGTYFVAGISIRGEDSPGILNHISNSITSYKNTNIKSVNMSSSDSMFEGAITLYVEDTEHLNRLIERLKKNKSIYSVERFDTAS